jgi:hypothetical protein
MHNACMINKAMSTSVKSRPKSLIFDTPVMKIRLTSIPESYVVDGNVDLAWLEKLSPLKRKIFFITDKWKAIYKQDEQEYKRVGNSRQLNKIIQNLLQTEKNLKDEMPWLQAEEGISITFLKNVQKGELKRIAVRLSWRAQKTGRRSQWIIARCAEELAGAFKQATGKRNWPEVGKIIAREFPNSPKAKKAGDWISRLVKRHQAERKEIMQLEEWKPPVFLNPYYHSRRSSTKLYKNPVASSSVRARRAEDNKQRETKKAEEKTQEEERSFQNFSRYMQARYKPSENMDFIARYTKLLPGRTQTLREWDARLAKGELLKSVWISLPDSLKAIFTDDGPETNEKLAR